MLLPKLLLILLVCVAAAPAVAGPLEDGEAALSRDDYATAAKWFRQAAEQGNAEAQFYLGALYGKGDGVQRDYAAALTWYRKAAEQGHAGAQFNLGVAYANGEGVRRDYVSALTWYRKAAEQDNAAAYRLSAKHYGVKAPTR
jgi:uncharacterized protein